MAPITGTVQIRSDSQERVPDIARLQMLQKSAARWTRLLTKVRKRVRRVHLFEFQIQERRPRGSQTTIDHGGGYLSTDLEVRFADAGIWSAGDSGLVTRTGEQIQLSDIDRNTRIATIIRDTGDTGAFALNDGDYVVRTGNVVGEGYTVGAGYATAVTRTTNFVETVSTPISWTGHKMKEWSYMSDEQKASRLDADREDSAIAHIKDVNRRLLLGRKGTAFDDEGNTIYFMNGLWYSITSLYDHAGGQPITETQFTQEAVEPVFINASDSDEKWALCSRVAMTELERMGRDRMRYNDKLSGQLGFNVTAYQNGAGTINLVHEPNFDESHYHSEAMTITDLNYVQLVLMTDTEHRDDLELKKKDVSLEEYRTQPSLEVSFPEVMINLRDLRTAA